MSKFILAIDQGTTSSRVLVIDQETRLKEIFTHDFKQIFKDDQVLQNSEEIYLGLKDILDKAINKYKKENIVAIGITNQRETTVIFDEQGNPLDYAISWQSKHTKEICDTWSVLGYAPLIKETTGLEINPYFSASKMVDLLNKPHIKTHLKTSKAFFGTMDTFILYKLTNGKSFFTDITNASRTMVFDINKKVYCERLLSLFNIPKEMLAEVKSNNDYFGDYLGIPIKAMIGDQQSALFGHLCLSKGTMKVTYGTGAFILMNTGEEVYQSKSGLISTIFYDIDGITNYALEGSIFIAGASVLWLKDQLNVINESYQSEEEALKSNNEMYFVPAFVGLGAPYWDSDVRGAMFGITQEINKADIIKATLNAIAYQVKDVVDVMLKEAKMPLKEVHIDGGVSKNNYLMQFQADLLRCPLVKPVESEITGLGAAFIAGLGTFFPSLNYLKEKQQFQQTYHPLISFKEASKLYEGWKIAVNSARSYKP